MKKYNRRCELKLRDAELLFSVGLILERIPVADISDVRARIEEGWRLLLVNQFHDVLPGSSIELAHIEAKQWFRDSLKLAEEVVNQCISYLNGSTQPVSEHTLLNTLPWPRNALLYENEKPTLAITVLPMSWDSSEFVDLHPVVLGRPIINCILTKLCERNTSFSYRKSWRNFQDFQ